MKLCRIVLPMLLGFFFVLFVMGSAQQAFGQNTGAMLPFLPPSFLNASGLVASSGRLCTTSTGTSTALATYSDTSLSTALPNPIVLDSLGRPTTNGSTLTNVYLQAASYRITLYASGTGNTCNGTAVGTQLWQRDGVYDLALLMTEDFNPKILDNVTHCAQYTGATAGAKIAACIADLPSTGGVADASGLEGAQTISADPFTGITKAVTLKIGAATYSSSVSLTVPSNITLDFAQGGILSMASATTATINGSVMGTMSQHFAGSGDFQLNGPQGYIPVQWFGALGDGSTSDSTAIQRAVTALTGKGGTLFFSRSGRYPITSTVTISSLRPIHLRCDMFGSMYDTDSQGNGAILLGATIAGPMFIYTAPDSDERATTGGGSVEGCAFTEDTPTGRTFTTTAILDLHDFPLSQIRNNIFQHIAGSAILGEFLVMSEISGNVIRYVGDTSRPAIDLSNAGGAFIAQSLKIDGNRIEVIYNAEYINIDSTLTDISLIDNRFEADTTTAATNNQFLVDAAFYGRIIGNQFNRNTGIQATISGAGNAIVGNTFRGGAYATTALVISGGRNTLTGNTFDSTRTGLEVSMSDSTNFVGNNMYFSGCILLTGATGATVTGNTIRDSTCTSAAVSNNYWIDTGASDNNTITGNVLDNTNGSVSDVGGIRVAGNYNVVSGNTVKGFDGSSDGAIGILVASNTASVTGNTAETAPISLTSFGGGFAANVTDDDPPMEWGVTTSFGALSDGGFATVIVATTGTTGGQIVDSMFGPITAGHHLQAVVASDAVHVTLFNDTGMDADLGSGTLTVRVRTWSMLPVWLLWQLLIGVGLKVLMGFSRSSVASVSTGFKNNVDEVPR